MILTQLIISATERNTMHLAGMHHCHHASSRIWQSEIRHQLRQQCGSWGEMLAVARELRLSGNLSQRERREPVSAAYSFADLQAQEDAGAACEGDRFE